MVKKIKTAVSKNKKMVIVKWNLLRLEKSQHLNHF